MTEHKDLYNKPWNIWACEQCRECSHYKYMHVLELPSGFSVSNVKITGTVGECQQLIDNGGFCSCREFLPTDNLDYIELLAKKKGIIPEDK